MFQGKERRGPVVRTALKHTLPYIKLDTKWKFALRCRKLKSGALCNLEGWDGVGGGGKIQEGGDMCIPMAESCWCMAKTNIILQSNYPPTKNKFKLRKEECSRFLIYPSKCHVILEIICTTLHYHESLSLGQKEVTKMKQCDFFRGNSMPERF